MESADSVERTHDDPMCSHRHTVTSSRCLHVGVVGSCAGGRSRAHRSSIRSSAATPCSASAGRG
jgi:hypothetical protein